MSVGDSAEELISIHALGRKMLLELSCGLPSHNLEIMFIAGWEKILVSRSSLSFLHTPAAKCVFGRSLIGARYNTPAVE